MPTTEAVGWEEVLVPTRAVPVRCRRLSAQTL